LQNHFPKGLAHYKTLFFFFKTVVAIENYPAQNHINKVNKVLGFVVDNLTTKVRKIADNKVFMQSDKRFETASILFRF
jgi:hypothetical protein